MKTQLKRIRKYRKITQQQMADMLGVKVRRYMSWERNETEISAEYLVACADILECSCDELVGLPINNVYSDPREAELHRVYQKLDDPARDVVLDVARGQLAMGRNEKRNATSRSMTA